MSEQDTAEELRRYKDITTMVWSSLGEERSRLADEHLPGAVKRRLEQAAVDLTLAKQAHAKVAEDLSVSRADVRKLLATLDETKGKLNEASHVAEHAHIRLKELEAQLATSRGRVAELQRRLSLRVTARWLGLQLSGSWLSRVIAAVQAYRAAGHLSHDDD